MISQDLWKPTDGISLEPNAHKAVVTDEGSVIVAAGPGAGKTELLAQRADFLLQTGTCPYPRRILAISFKVDAAQNLRERVQERAGARNASRFDSLTFHAFAKRIIDNYRLALSDEHFLISNYSIGNSTEYPNAISFKDMVPLAIEILENNPYALWGLRQTYSHVFFDEFQDATRDQYKLLVTAFGETSARLTAVGDTKQRIMTFAGALDGIMEKFANDFDALRLTLYQNRRSAPVLRRMQNRMILDMDRDAAIPVENLVGEAGCIEVCPFTTSTEEAEKIAELVTEQLEAGVPAKEIAVLVRQQAGFVAAELFDAFDRHGITYRNDQELQDIVSDPVATLIFNFVLVLVGDHEPYAYTEFFDLLSVFTVDEEQGARLNSKINKLFRTLSSCLYETPDLILNVGFWKQAIQDLLDIISFSNLLIISPICSTYDDVQKLIEDILVIFEETNKTAKNPCEAIYQITGANAIRVLTIHKSKGLEFRHVIVMGVEKQLFWGNFNTAISEFFVAISRAKERLTLTYCRERNRPEGFSNRWDVMRTPYTEFLRYADE